MDVQDVLNHLQEIRNCIKDPEKRVAMTIAIEYVRRGGLCMNYSSFEGQCIPQCKPCSYGGYKDMCKD